MQHKTEHNIRIRKPKWLRRKLPTGPEYEQVRKLIGSSGLATVCQEAQCPNQFECFSRGTATFMILGDKCTRNCRFCAVEHLPSTLPDPEEPRRVAEAITTLGLRYAVITSVTRDDLADGGASGFANTIRAIHEVRREILVEVLIPDLQGNWQALGEILAAAPHVLNHNIETVPRLYRTVRPQAVYQRSLDLLKEAKRLRPEIPTKSGVMLGLGETEDELMETLGDVRRSGCDLLSMGQYLQPSKNHLAVEKFVPPETFERYRVMALAMGFSGVASGPSVRSSFEAEVLYREVIGKKQT